MVGQEYCVGDLRASKGDSLKVNLTTGKWSDFAAGEAGGDLISLYAAINSMDQKTAYNKLCESSGHSPTNNKSKPIKKIDHDQDRIQFAPPPKGTPMPDQLATQSIKWRYCSLEGETLFLTTRFDVKGKKQFCPWSWSLNKGWVKKIWPAPRPLYGLQYIGKNPDKPILIVEGEKAADAARKFAGRVYNVITWSGGAKAFDKSDWLPVYGKRILMWPDADDAGLEAANGIAEMLEPHCDEVKILDVMSGGSHPKGWDAADSQFNWNEFMAWAKPIAKLYEPPQPDIIEPPVSDEVPLPTEADMGPLPDQMLAEYVDAAQDKMPHKYTAAQFAIWQDIGLVLNASGSNPQYNVDNAMIVLERFKPLKNLVWYDEFHQKFMTYWMVDGDTPREWADEDDVRLMRFMQSEIGMVRTTRQMITDAVQLYARSNRRNEPREFFNSLEWDGTHRVHAFFHTHLGAIDSEYTRAVSKNFWVSMVARIMRPGCKADNMVILEGPQGAYKSTALSVIGGPWYTESNESMSSKDFYQVFQGNLIIEIAELDSFNKAETTTIKKVVSTQVDRFRPPYGRAPKDHPRQCIFVGTTNDNHYLRDTTGARRFWPITVTQIDLSGIKRDRQQLFAEAIHLFKSGEDWYSVPATAAAEQELRREEDIWEPIIDRFLLKDSQAAIHGYVTIEQIARDALKIDYDKQNMMTNRRIGAVLRSLGCESKPMIVPGLRKTERRFYFERSTEQLDLDQKKTDNQAEYVRPDVPNYAPQ
jgi:predicted P-loop ATPase